jgi:DNA-binding LytR/AlgR family response regulator
MERKIRKSENPYYPDFFIFLILIPFISAINYYLTYANIKWGWFLVVTFTIDTLQGYLSWLAVRLVILKLDKKWPIQIGGIARIGIQLLSTLFIGLLIITLLTELVSWIAKGTPAALSFYSVDLFIIGIWFFVVNGIYIGLYYHHLTQRMTDERNEEMRSISEGILVRSGKQEIRLRFEELAGFSVDKEYAIVIHLSGRKYFLDQSLDKIEKTLPVLQFFRLNRQYILHKQIIVGFKREENGKIMVISNGPQPMKSEIVVSRIKAPAFKAWFRPE